MIFLKPRSTSLENGKIPLMRFDCSWIQNWFFKTFVSLKMQEFQNLLPHLHLDQIIDRTLYYFPHLFLQIESLVPLRIILVCAPLLYFQLLKGHHYFPESYCSLYMMHFQLRLPMEYLLNFFLHLLKHQLNSHFLSHFQHY